ncbi:hypothetical protein ACHAW6_005369 [Cyclotella cf. meneghiniana]
MGGCLSAENVALVRFPPRLAVPAAKAECCVTSPATSSRSELTSHMIRERKHHNVWDYYQLIRLLGEGSIGEVNLVRRKKGTEGGSAYQTKKGVHRVFGCCSHVALNDIERGASPSLSMHSEEYALKCIQLRLVQKIYLDELRNEIEVLRSLDHPNIVKAYEVYETPRNIYVLMEYCSGGDLYSRSPYTESAAASLMAQLASAIAHMHKHNVVHRDLKCENIMFESKEDPMARIKVLDFGLSKKFLPGMSKVMTEGVGTLYTMAPQVFQGTYSSKADCWSMGVIAYILLSQKKPFASKTRAQTKAKIMKCQYNFDAEEWKSISAVAKDFVSSLIVFEPTDRLSAKQAVEHSWLKNNAAENTETSAEFKRQNSLMKHVHDRILGYGSMSELRRIASVVVAHKSSTAEIIDIRKAFENFDKEKDGVISIDEFKAAFSQFNYTEEEMNNMFSYLVSHFFSLLLVKCYPCTYLFATLRLHALQDVNGCNEITYTEFIAATLDLHGRVEEKRLAEAFDLMDDDDSGYISKEDLIKLLGKSVSPYRIDALIQQADFDGDGRISFADFLEMFRVDNCKCANEALGLQSSLLTCTEGTSTSEAE